MIHKLTAVSAEFARVTANATEFYWNVNADLLIVSEYSKPESVILITNVFENQVDYMISPAT